MAARRIRFVKAHALGNDFLLVEQAELIHIDPEQLARAICHRHTGIGADGLVVLGPSQLAHASFSIYNSDGSEATLSGDALRCAAAWQLAADRLGSSAEVGTRIALDTRVGIREVFFRAQNGAQWFFRTRIGRPSFAAAEVPFRPPREVREPITQFPLPVGDVTVPVTVLSMGNPQCTLFVEDFASLDWQGLGAEIERHPFFPDRTNVGFVRVLDSDRIEARFWERGAGHTLASGTGSCACAVAAHLAGKVGRRVTVVVERGEMEVDWREDGVVELTGPAEIVAEGDYLWAMESQ